MTPLTEFLLARITEDKAVAEAAIKSRPRGQHDWDDDLNDGIWKADDRTESIEGEHMEIYDEGGHTHEHAVHIARFDPSRILAQCSAMTKMLDKYYHIQESLRNYPNPGNASSLITAEHMLRLVALLYVDHPDYQREWRL
jgi:hypothetical protein